MNAKEYLETQQVKLNAERLKLVKKATEDFCYALECDVSENGAYIDIKLKSINNILNLINRHEDWQKRLESALERNITDLVGGEDSLVDTYGPWNASSNSVGTNRLAIIRANCTRWRIGLIRTLLILDK